MVTCIIPFYNENSQLLSILSTLKKVKSISQVICVDDGSKNNLSQQISDKFPEVDLIVLSENRGKASAVKEGLKKATNEIIFLLDADLENLNSEELEKPLIKFIENPDIDLVILENKGDNPIDVLLRKSIFLSGKRILKKNDLEKILKGQLKKYELEAAINSYMIENNKSVYWAKNSARNPHKTRKNGFIKGAIRDLKMEIEIILYLNPFGYLKQMLFFARRELKI